MHAGGAGYDRVSTISYWGRADSPMPSSGNRRVMMEARNMPSIQRDHRFRSLDRNAHRSIEQAHAD